MRMKTPSNIIEKDKEMEEMIRQLVKCAIEKEIKITALTDAVKEIYREEQKKESDNNVKITPETHEVEFAEKVKKFLDFYETGLIEVHDQAQASDYFKIANSSVPRIKKNFLEKLYQLFWGMKMVFEDEEAETITMKQVEKVVKAAYGQKVACFSGEIDLLFNFFYFHLKFDGEKKPEYFADRRLWYDPESLVKNQEFINFQDQYSFKKTTTNKTAIAAIWLIEKYF